MRVKATQELDEQLSLKHKRNVKQNKNLENRDIAKK